jgi:indole-3-glycerol phosphate synthase/phosphoribosylanthranilate isomerase
MILDDIVKKTKTRLNHAVIQMPLEVVKGVAKKSERPFAFKKAISVTGTSFICEIKRASPSKGEIVKDFPYLQIAKEYESAGASAISVLTEPFFFKGNNRYLTEIADVVSVPILRKDFVIDEYMIYEARAIGADAVLLICAILKDRELADFIKTAHRLGMDALVETHDEEEIERALNAGADIIGVNNRDLTDFSIDIYNSVRLRDLVPENVVFVSESGINTPEDVSLLRAANVDAVLIGESLMRKNDRVDYLRKLRGNNTKVKLCGMFRDDDIAAVNEAHPDYVGFVFAESKRKVTVEQAKIMKNMLNPEIQAIGVFVDEKVGIISQIASKGIIDMIQLHGDESEDYISTLRLLTDRPIIKAFKVSSKKDIALANASSADLVLLDADVSNMVGGTGQKFDHTLLLGMNRRYVLAGGLNEDNIQDVVEEYHPYCVDVSSGAETEGLKDPVKIKEIVRRVRNA